MPKFYVSKRIGGIVEAVDVIDAEDRFAQYANEATDDEFDVRVREILPWENTCDNCNMDQQGEAWNIDPCEACEKMREYWVDLTSPEIMAPNRETAIKLADGMLTTGELHKDIRLVNVEES